MKGVIVIADKGKHIPERMCAGCRQMFEKHSLIRVVSNGDTLEIDMEHKTMSRGVYVCKNEECIMRLQKRKAFNVILKKHINEEFYRELTEYAAR